jgi:RHS repeat-associated protein
MPMSQGKRNPSEWVIHPHSTDKYQYTTGNPYGNQEDHPISSMIEKVSNTYDGFNRLKQVDKISDGERVTVEYTYNGDGLRTQKAVKSSKEGYISKVTKYFYDRQHVILETDGTNDLKTRYVRGLNYIARYSSANQLSYYLYNGHGDVVQMVSEAGVVENQYDYDIFGNPILTVEVYENAIRYAGEFYDAETGLYYLRARYYDPYTGRFISEDSYWGEDSNPLSLNLYTYGYNNPLMYIDPTGHSSEVPEWLDWDRDGVVDSRDDMDEFDKNNDNIADWLQVDTKDDWEHDEDQGWGARKNDEDHHDSGSSGNSDIPGWLDWDGDGVIDSSDDMDLFDQNNDQVADWLQTDTDEDWVFTGNAGWDHRTENLTSSGPSAEQVQLFIDKSKEYMSSSDRDQMYTSGGVVRGEGNSSIRLLN